MKFEWFFFMSTIIIWFLAMVADHVTPRFWAEVAKLYEKRGIFEYARRNERYLKGRKYLQSLSFKYNYMMSGKPNHNNVSVGGPKMDENTNTANAGAVNDPAAAAAPGFPGTATQPPTATSKPRNKSVKGAMKLARDMKDAGKTREEIAKAVVELYVAGGRTEKDAKYFASGALWSVFGPTNPRKAPAIAVETPVPTPTPQTNT